MVLVLCIGDLHIPYRAVDLPAKFKSLLVPGKIHHILCPGNICSQEPHAYLKTVCADLHVTQGDFDVKRYPEEKVLEIEEFRIGLCHGHQIIPWGNMEALAQLQRRLNVDILVSGHTHEFKAYQVENRLLINPGSATGAYSTITSDVKPSFVLMDLNAFKATVYVYELVSGEVKVENIEFSPRSSEALERDV